MQNDSYRIHISLKGEDVVIHRLEGVPEDVWESATLWWSNSAIQVTGSSIRLSLIDFDSKKSWLRKVWDPITYPVSIQNPEVQDALGSLKKELDEFEDRLLNGAEPDPDEILKVTQSPGVKRSPTLEQAKNVASLLKMANGANFSVPGAGKTSTEYLLWHNLKLFNVVSKMLIVCPKSSFEAWQTEPAKMFEFPLNIRQFDGAFIPGDADVLLVNYEQLERTSKLNLLKTWIDLNDVMLVVDEAHRIKGGARSVRWRAVKNLSRLVKRCDILTGTPMPQGPDDLRNLFSITWKNLPENYLSDQKLSDLRPWTVFVRTTKDQLGLPPVRIEKVPIELGVIQSDIYAALGKNYQGTLQLKSSDRATLARKGRAVFTLIAAATNPGLLVRNESPDSFLDLQWPPKEISTDAELTSVLRNYVRHELPPKYEWLAKFVEASSQSGRKVLIWSTFVGNLLAMAHLLKKYKPALVHGAVASEDRQIEIERFRNSEDCHVLISNPQTLGEGVSLHEHCHDAVFLDRSFNASQYLQALDRIHRLGLAPDQSTRVYLLESKGTIDDQVDIRLGRKIRKLGEFLNDAGLALTSLPGDEEIESGLDLLGLDEADLDAILKHLEKF